MSRPVEPVRASRAPAESDLELEELGDEAILAHETAAHLPQKRARVTEEARSIVIAEPSPARKPFKADRGEPTVVASRHELEVARKRILQGRKRLANSRRLLWLALAAAAFVGGALVVFLSTRSAEPTPFSQATVLSPVREAKPAAAASAAAVEPREVERVPPKVSLEELPLERPRRRQ